MTLYQCPVCQQPLSVTDRVYSCANNHRFDQHKKGYVNLLLVQNKRSKTPGDDADMVLSRRRFLNDGHYQPLADFIANSLSSQYSGSASLWDAGCGEGYYTHKVKQRNPDWSVYGLDISKPAITAASQYKDIHWCVASSSHPPYLDNSFDAIFSVFSRVDSDPFHRVLKPGGSVSLVAPDADHLHNLRSVIYDTVRPYDTSKHKSYLDDRFELVSEERLEVPLQLNSHDAVMDLVGMTPHAHRMSAEIKARLQNTPTLTDTGCFKIYRFIKKSVN